VRATLRGERPKIAFVYSSPMAQYVLDGAAAGLTRVVDFVDVDSEKWRAYAALKPWPLSAVYAREAERLLAFERRVAGLADACVFVSGDEARLFERLRGEPGGNVHAVNNGVDLAYFATGADFANPYPSDVPVLVFTGAMDYWANADAVRWFATEVFPLVRAQVPTAEFWIVGTRPLPEVCALARLPQVRVTGAVDDIRPYLAHGRLAVAPLRIARGVQNKVLEAMAMGRPIVGTSAAFEGLELEGRYRALTADSPAEFATRCVEVLGGAHAECGPVGHDYVAAHHDWTVNMGRLHALMVH
jgi:sugar transferase (PEP-CTERM/EpsH1 system associated)